MAIQLNLKEQKLSLCSSSLILARSISKIYLGFLPLRAGIIRDTLSPIPMSIPASVAFRWGLEGAKCSGSVLCDDLFLHIRFDKAKCRGLESAALYLSSMHLGDLAASLFPHVSITLFHASQGRFGCDL